jgi:Flp pilus assembly protein TadG
MVSNFFKNERGQALVEMAFVLPILLMLVFGITEFGRIFGAELILSNSAREGARYAAVGASDSEIVSKVISSTSILDNTKLLIIISPSESSRKRGEAVKIKVQYPVEVYAPIISNITGDPYIAKGEATMRME